MPKTDKSEQRSTRKSKKRDNKGFPYKKRRSYYEKNKEKCLKYQLKYEREHKEKGYNTCSCGEKKCLRSRRCRKCFSL